MLPLESSKLATKEGSVWGQALNQALGLEGLNNIPQRTSLDALHFVYDLASPFGYLATDIKGQTSASNANLVGVSNLDYGMIGIGGLAANDVIIQTGPTAQQGVVNMRVTGCSLQVVLNAAGVAALAGKTVRFQWAEYLGAGISPVVTLATQDVLSPGLRTFSNLQQLLGFPYWLPYPNTLICTVSTLDGTVFPAATNVRREARVITRPLKLPLPV